MAVLYQINHTVFNMQKGKYYLICPLTSGRFFVLFMLESKGTSKYCGDRRTSGLVQESDSQVPDTRHQTRRNKEELSCETLYSVRHAVENIYQSIK